VRFTVDHELTEEDGSTLVRVTAEGKTSAFMKLAEPVLARTAEKELRQDFDRLKEILEAS
jgi:carbon monoxide dehydrogenase subunit G